MTSLAGSLTYFFNAQGQVEHISFRGRTGDTTQLGAIADATLSVSTGVGADRRTGVSGRQRRTRAERAADAAGIGVVVERAAAERRRGAGTCAAGFAAFLPPRGPALQIPQVAAPAVARIAAPRDRRLRRAARSVKSAASNYFDKIRYATPQEEAELHWKRWPN